MKVIAAAAAAFAVTVGFVSVVLGGAKAPPAIADAGDGLRPGSVPAAFEPHLIAAAKLCPEITAPLLAAQIEAESNFDVNAVSPVGARGPAQFMPGTWAIYGRGGDPHDPADAIPAQATYMCALVGIVRKLGGDTVGYALAAYNAGPARILGCRCIPRNGQTEFYVPKIRRLMAKYVTSLAISAGTGGWVKPVNPPYGIGAIFHQSGRLWSRGWHTGYDYVVPTGTDVFASQAGTVVSSGWGGAYGWHIVIDHGSKIISTYSHLSELAVRGGDKVTTGQTIARSGNTGNTTGPHLHFEIKLNGTFVDPIVWIANRSGTADTPDQLVAAVIKTARGQLGVPYVFGGGSLSGPSPVFPGGTAGFDCSSLTRYAWYTASGGDTKLPRVAHDQYGDTKPIQGEPQPGDLIFYKTGRVSGRWDHVGLYIGGGQMIHAPRPGKSVEIIDTTRGYYKTTPHEARRVTP